MHKYITGKSELVANKGKCGIGTGLKASCLHSCKHLYQCENNYLSRDTNELVSRCKWFCINLISVTKGSLGTLEIVEIDGINDTIM